MERSRVAFTPGSIPTAKASRRRYRCDCHLCEDAHFIEAGERYIHNALPPHHPDIGNDRWWHARFCLQCSPLDQQPAPKEF